MTALFCTPLDIKKNSVISGDLDNDKLTYQIKNSQIIHVQNYTGTKLYNRLQEGALASTLNTDEELLIDEYINPMLVSWVLSDYVDTGAYNISNKGILKHTDETSQTVSVGELNTLSLNYQKRAEYFTQRLIDYLCDKSSLYPEYTNNSGADINPNSSSNYGGLFLD